ncbi:MAG: alpha/beta hydrolase [Flavobacteriales bacterium]|nr:alpha/beta hydrolase [Flavobacteriales bacterium]
MLSKFNFKINGSRDRNIIIDSTLIENNHLNEVILFSHGFKGFKDWGPFNEIANFFALNGYVFIKFNFSYNGTNFQNPTDFVDLNAFGNNNFCTELDDLELVIKWIKTKYPNCKVSLFGHSRGGAISILKSNENNQIDKVISWASPSNLISRLPDADKARRWKDTNVVYVYNGRTKQNMPMFYQFYQNCIENIERLNIKKAIKEINIPHLHIHGSSDPTVLIEDALEMKRWNDKVNLEIINEADHVFGSSHPYNKNKFPLHLNKALLKTLEFLKS